MTTESPGYYNVKPKGGTETATEKCWCEEEKKGTYLRANLGQVLFQGT